MCDCVCVGGEGDLKPNHLRVAAVLELFDDLRQLTVRATAVDDGWELGAGRPALWGRHDVGHTRGVAHLRVGGVGVGVCVWGGRRGREGFLLCFLCLRVCT